MSSEIINPISEIKVPYFENKVPCKRCHGLIAVKTALKHEGYSAQCLKKKLAEDNVNEEKKAISSQKVQTDLTADETRYYLSKTRIPKIQIYTYEQFVYIWAVKQDQKKYYNSYLNQVSLKLSGLSLIDLKKAYNEDKIAIKQMSKVFNL